MVSTVALPGVPGEVTFDDEPLVLYILSPAAQLGDVLLKANKRASEKFGGRGGRWKFPLLPSAAARLALALLYLIFAVPLAHVGSPACSTDRKSVLC
jgi:hypothetical protein